MRGINSIEDLSRAFAKSYLLFIKMSLEVRLEGLRPEASGQKLIDQGNGHGPRWEQGGSALLGRQTLKGREMRGGGQNDPWVCPWGVWIGGLCRACSGK